MKGMTRNPSMRASFIKGIIAAGICLLILNALLSQLETQRMEEELIDTSSYDSLTPGEFVGTIALAGFRAMAVDMLWVRAINLWKEKDWYQALAVYRLISKLQPHLEEAWVTNGWNMAVNIAVSKRQKGADAEAWAWVQEGLTYLKEGISRNPKSHYLHYYYGWLTYRMGQDEYYRAQFQQAGIDPLEESHRFLRKASDLKGPHYAYDSRLAFILHERGVWAQEQRNHAAALDFLKASKFHMERAFTHIPDGPSGSTVHINFLNFRESLSQKLADMDRLIQRLEKGEEIETLGAGRD